MSEYSNKQKTSAGQTKITVVGLDLGKTWVELCGQDTTGKVVMTGKYKPAKLKAVLAQLPRWPWLIAWRVPPMPCWLTRNGIRPTTWCSRPERVAADTE